MIKKPIDAAMLLSKEKRQSILFDLNTGLSFASVAKKHNFHINEVAGVAIINTKNNGFLRKKSL